MFVSNGKLTERQVLKIGIVENITFGMMFIPYICIKSMGRFHVIALVAGLIGISVYAVFVYLMSRVFPDGYLNAVWDCSGRLRWLLNLVYACRYLLKAGALIYMFSKIAKIYLMTRLNIWWIIITFTFICAYGSMRNIEKRGRMVEFFFWWMIIPLLMVAVFSFTKINISFGTDVTIQNILGHNLFDAVLFFICIFSTMELMIFTLASQKKNNWKSDLKILIWIIISVVMAYVYIVGILGEKWTQADGIAAFNVMGSVAIPGNLTSRFDYFALIFWMIGAFVTISGFMYFAKEFIGRIVECTKRGEEIESSEKWISFLIILISIFSCCLFMDERVNVYLLKYLVYVDIFFAVIIPLIIMLRKRRMLMVILIFGMSVSNTGCSQMSSIETRDYAIRIEINNDDIRLETADLEGYEGSFENDIKTNKSKFVCDSISEISERYLAENGRELDLGHLEKLVFDKNISKEKRIKILRELTGIQEINKSAEVYYNDEKILLFDLFKIEYERENLL